MDDDPAVWSEVWVVVVAVDERDLVLGEAGPRDMPPIMAVTVCDILPLVNAEHRGTGASGCVVVVVDVCSDKSITKAVAKHPPAINGIKSRHAPGKSVCHPRGVALAILPV